MTDALNLQVPAHPQGAVLIPARRTSTPLPMLTLPKVRLKELSEGQYARASFCMLALAQQRWAALGGGCQWGPTEFGGGNEPWGPGGILEEV